MRRALGAVVVVALVVVVPLTAGAVSLGVLDTFQNGTTEGWFAGLFRDPSTPPHVEATGGPGGAGDAYLVVTAVGGFGAGSRLVTMNRSQWAGDYLTAGIPTIAMDLKNFGTTDLTIRLLFENPTGALPTDAAVTNLGAVVPVGGDWTHVVFPIDSSALTATLGTVTDALSGTTQLRIMHNALADAGADAIVGVLGIDNIMAGAISSPPSTPVPEPDVVAFGPTAVLLFAIGVRTLRRAGAPA
jgi:hypothetical protein